MARSDLILSLVRTAMRGEWNEFKNNVKALAAEEKAKGHTTFASQLLAELKTNAKPNTWTHINPFVTERTPTRSLTELILPEKIEESIKRFVEEYHQADKLKKSGLEPRNRILITGEPGCGKTSLAEAIAHTLNIPLYIVQHRVALSEQLEEIVKRIDAVFDYVQSKQCVLLFDDFDIFAMGQEKELNENALGRTNSTIRYLLSQICALPHNVVTIVTSDYTYLAHRSISYKFQLILQLCRPLEEDTGKWIARLENRIQQKLDLSPNVLHMKFLIPSYTELEEFGQKVLRIMRLNGKTTNIHDAVKEALNQLPF